MKWYLFSQVANQMRLSSLKMPIKWCLLIEKGIQKLKQYTTSLLAGGITFVI